MKKASPLIAAAFLTSFYGVSARLMAPYFSPLAAIFWRTIWVVLILGIILIIKRKSLRKPSKNDIPWFLVNGFVGTVIGVTAFVAVNNLTLGTAPFLFYSGSIITSYILGNILLKEKLTQKKIISLIFALLGLGIIYNITIKDYEFIYIILGFIAGLGFGIYQVTTKRLSGKYSNIEINFNHYTLTTLGALLLAPFFDFSADLNPTSITISILTACMVLTAGSLIVYGYKRIEVQMGSLIMNLDPIFATIWGLIFFAESIMPQSIIGALFILTSMSIPNINWKKSKDNPIK